MDLKDTASFLWVEVWSELSLEQKLMPKSTDECFHSSVTVKL